MPLRAGGGLGRLTGMGDGLGRGWGEGLEKGGIDGVYLTEKTLFEKKLPW